MLHAHVTPSAATCSRTRAGEPDGEPVVKTDAAPRYRRQQDQSTVQHDRVDVEIGQVVYVTHMHHMFTRPQQQRPQLILCLGIGLRDMSVAPEGSLSQ